MGTIGRTIVTLQLVGDSMCGEVSLQGSDHFFGSLLLKLGNFKVGGIVIFCAEEVSVLKVDNVASNCFSWTVWNFVTDTWFLLPIFLVSSTHATLCYVVPKVSVHARHVVGSLQLLCGHHGVVRVSWASGWEGLHILNL